MRTVCIIQARMGSSRLPGKVMKDLNGHPVLWHVIERVRTAGKQIDEVVVATSTLPPDNIIEENCKNWGIPCFRGDELDVLSRYHGAAKLYKAECVIRVTADCPLLDPEVLEAMLKRWKKEKVDYLSNVIPIRTFPKGLDIEMFTYEALDRAFKLATENYDREHVTPYIYKHPEVFRIFSYTNDKDLSVHRWTLDTPEDMELISYIYKKLPTNNNTKNILKLFKKEPALMTINQPEHVSKGIILYLGYADSPVVEFLRNKGYTVHSTNMKIDERMIKPINLDALVSYGYRYIIDRKVLKRFKKEKAMNLHISYLPWNRGADPNLWSFVDNTPKGVSIHCIDEGIDTGDILLQQEVNLDSEGTLATTYKSLRENMDKLFMDNYQQLLEAAIKPRKQEGIGSYHNSSDKKKLAHLLSKGWDTPVMKLVEHGTKNKN